MNPLLTGLIVVNLLLTTTVLVVALARRVRIPESSSTSATEIRQDLSAWRSELAEAFRRDRDERQAESRESRAEAASLKATITEHLTGLRLENEAKLDKVRELVDEKLRATLATSLKENADRIEGLTKANSDKHLELQSVLRDELQKLRDGNEAKLEKMRETVDEKLQGTLEKRLGESFGLVSARLEEVQKGLGEMQSLASDVGGLKRVLTNVKNRGGWGEVQLSRQLEDILTAEQYEENVAVRPGAAERVEFAVKMPGREDGGSSVYLPIDSKLPQEDYERLLDTQETGDKVAMEEAGKALERAILEQAKTISKKYIEPPYTTDFAILYLPTEGLFAEVVRRPGLASKLQTEHRIMITGPTTLMSILNSLQMGFRTLAIEKRSSEVWQVLAAAKTEFHKYGQVWVKLEKQLQTAQNTVAEAGQRNRVIERKLRSVESPGAAGVTPVEDLPDSALSTKDELAALDGLDGVGRPPLDRSLVEPLHLADEGSQTA